MGMKYWFKLKLLHCTRSKRPQSDTKYMKLAQLHRKCLTKAAFFFYNFLKDLSKTTNHTLLALLCLSVWGETSFMAHFLSLLLQNVMYVFRRTAFLTAHTFKHSKFCMTLLLIICPLAPAQTQRWCVSWMCLGLTHLTLCSLASSISLCLFLS